MPTATGVDVTTHKEMEHADGFCHPARDNWDDENRKYAESYLTKVKATTEETPLPLAQAQTTDPNLSRAALTDAPTASKSAPAVFLGSERLRRSTWRLLF